MGQFLRITLPTSGARLSSHTSETPQGQPDLSIVTALAYMFSNRKHLQRHALVSSTCFLKQEFLAAAILSQQILLYTKKKKNEKQVTVVTFIFKISSDHTDTAFTKPKPLGSSNRIS